MKTRFHTLWTSVPQPKQVNRTVATSDISEAKSVASLSDVAFRHTRLVSKTPLVVS